MRVFSFCLLLGAFLCPGCATHTTTLDSREQVRYYDRNGDGRVDQEKHHFPGVADVDLLHDEVFTRGAVVQLPPTNQTWGTRETGIRDPDGNVLIFAAKRPDIKVA